MKMFKYQIKYEVLWISNEIFKQQQKLSTKELTLLLKISTKKGKIFDKKN